MKNIKLNGTQFSQILNVSPQAVAAFARKGQLIRNDVGLFDISDPVNKAFLKNRNIDIKKISILPDQPRLGRPVISRPQGQIVPVTTVKPTVNVSQSELTKKHLEAKIEKLKIQINAANKVLLPTDFIEQVLLRHLELLHSTLERTASVSVLDIGQKILEAGEIKPEHIQYFTNLILTSIHNTKLRMKEEIKIFVPK